MKRYNSVFFRQKRVCYQDITRVLGCSRKLIARWTVHNKNEKASFEDAPRSGRPTEVDPDLQIGAYKATVSSRDAARLCTVSQSTILRTAKKYKYKRMAKKKQQFISKANILKRFAFATHHIQAQTNWRNVAFSDESMFEVGGNLHEVIGPGDEREVRATVQHPISVMVWGAISYEGRSYLKVFVHEKMKKNGEKKMRKGKVVMAKEECKSEDYLQLILQTYRGSLLNLFPSYHLDKNSTKDHYFQLMQDNAPPHVKAAPLIEKKGLFILPNWPPSSPDLNPIEHVWHELKRRVRNDNTITLLDLKEKVEKHWYEIPQDFFRRLVDSMNNRFNKTIENGGGHSGY